MTKGTFLHGLIFALFGTLFVFFIHHLPVNHIFIDAFSEAIKSHDIMDIAFSKFRDHEDPKNFDKNVLILNSEITNRVDIAHTIDFLNRNQVGAIGVDLMFDTLHNSPTDTLLANSLNNPNIVLGFTMADNHDHSATELATIRSHSFFTQNATQSYVNLGSNDGFSVRTFEPVHQIEGREDLAFALGLVDKVDENIIKEVKERCIQKEWINYKRLQPGVINMRYPINEAKAVHYSYSTVKDFLQDTGSYSPAFIKDKIVLIGFCGENKKALSMKDRYFTPLNEKYQGRSLPDMHGVVVHANIVSMLMSRDFIDEVKELYLYFIAFLIFLVNYFVFNKLIKRKLFFYIPVVPAIRVIQLIEFVVLFSVCILALILLNIKIGFIILITAVFLSFELFEFYDHKLEERIDGYFFNSNTNDT